MLFLAGACDSILTPELQRQQMQYFPNARLVVIQNAGHDVFTEQPDASLVPVRTYVHTNEIGESQGQVVVEPRKQF